VPRARWYQDYNVVTAGRERVRHIDDLFDHMVVQFSGGKDSLATLLLVKEMYEERGYGKVPVVFRHEEVINPSVLEFMETFRHYDWLDLHWMCISQKNSKFVLGRKETYTEWDTSGEREWVTQPPEWAIMGSELGIEDANVLDQNSLDDYIADYLFSSGKVAFVTGVRASESLVRFRSVTQKLNENYISSIEHNARSRVKLCKPIYDWSQDDVFKFMIESGEQYCPLYDAQELAGMGLRVSTALHVVASKKLDKLAVVEPEFFQTIVNVFPEMQDQERYWGQFDQDAIIRPYKGKGWNGVMRYIKENVPESNQRLAYERVKLWRGRHENAPEDYPIDLLLRTIAFGTIKQRMAGVYVNSKDYSGGKENE